MSDTRNLKHEPTSPEYAEEFTHYWVRNGETRVGFVKGDRRTGKWTAMEMNDSGNHMRGTYDTLYEAQGSIS